MRKKNSLIFILLICLIFFSCWKSYTPTEKGIYARIKTTKGEIVVQLLPDIAPVTVSNFIGLAEGIKEWKDPNTEEWVKKPFYNGLIFHRVIKDFMIQGGCPKRNGSGGPGYAFEDECYEKLARITGKVDNEQVAGMVWTQLINPYMMRYRGQGPNAEINKIAMEVSKVKKGTPLYGKTVEYYQKATGITTDLYQRGRLLHPVAYGTLCMANAGPGSNGSQFFIVTRSDGASGLNGRHTVFGKVVHGMDVAHKIEKVKKIPVSNPSKQPEKPVKDVVMESVTIQYVN